MPIRGTSCGIFSEKKEAHLNGEFKGSMADPANSSVLLTPESSPSKDSSSSVSTLTTSTNTTQRKREKSDNECIQNSSEPPIHPHKQLLLVMQSSEKSSAKKKGPHKKHKVVSTHRNSLSPSQKPRSSNRQKKKSNNNTCNSQGQTTVTDYFPVRRSSRQTKTCLEIKKYKDIESAILDKKEDGLKVVDFNGKGRGVVATRPFARGEFVVEYAGDLITHKTAKDRERVYAMNPNFGCYMYYFNYNSKNYCVDATDESGRLGRLINHSRNGNCHTKLVDIKGRPYLILVASRDVKDGEELLYDYGDRRKSSIAAHPWLRE